MRGRNFFAPSTVFYWKERKRERNDDDDDAQKKEVLFSIKKVSFMSSDSN